MECHQDEVKKEMKGTFYTLLKRHSAVREGGGPQKEDKVGKS